MDLDSHEPRRSTSTGRIVKTFALEACPKALGIGLGALFERASSEATHNALELTQMAFNPRVECFGAN